MRIRSTLLASAALAVFGAAAFAEITPVTDEVLANPPAGSWLTAGFNQQNYRHSPLAEINAENVKGLQLIWSRGLEPGQVEATPLVHDGVIYMPNAGDIIQAIDAKSGDLLWEHRRRLPDVSTLSPAGFRTRGIAIYGTNIYFISADNHVVALDMATGQSVFDVDRGEGTQITNSTGPIIANGVLIAGSTCQYAPFGCYVSGHDANTGEELWRNYFIPKPGEEGDETWGNDFESRWMTGAWGQITFDPETGLVYYGSSSTGPASEIQRGTPGGSLYGTNTRFAVRPQTGEVVWRHQTLPRDNWDQECTFEMMAITTEVAPAEDMEGKLSINPTAASESRRVLTGVPCKTGTMWQFDAETGEFLWARDTVAQTMISSVDEKGIVTVNEDLILDELDTPYSICPSMLGGRNWPSSALNPETGVFFLPANEVCMELTALDQEFTSEDTYNTEMVSKLAPNTTTIGRVYAIDIKTGKSLWTAEREASNYSAILSTAGGVIFNGGTDRYFRALSQETGETLWQTRLSTTASGGAVSFELEGHQYVAIAGGGTNFGNVMNGALDKKIDATAVGGSIYVFGLPQ